MFGQDLSKTSDNLWLDFLTNFHMHTQLCVGCFLYLILNYLAECPPTPLWYLLKNLHRYKKNKEGILMMEGPNDGTLLAIYIR